MKIFTSYFGNLSKLKTSEIKPISIAIHPPAWYKGASLIELAPSYQMVSLSKSGQITWEEYERQFKSRLERRDPKNILRSLYIMGAGGDVALLCWEVLDVMCHRRLVAEWLKENISVEVIEFTGIPESKPDPQLNLF
jgi:uncharacterized protein YeaO (DUF488 family)